MGAPNLSLAFALAAALALAGCDDTIGILSGDAAPVAAPHPAAATALRVQSGDKIKVTVIGDDKVSGEFEVDDSGDVSIPAVGALHAVGRTKSELETKIAGRLREQQYLLNPMVTVDIAAFRPFYVLGEVEKPGEYPYHAGLNILSAVAVAGGDTYRASRSYALVQRAGASSFEKYPLAPNVPIYPGDLIKIPERYF